MITNPEERKKVIDPYINPQPDTPPRRKTIIIVLIGVAIIVLAALAIGLSAR